MPRSYPPDFKTVALEVFKVLQILRANPYPTEVDRKVVADLEIAYLHLIRRAEREPSREPTPPLH